jgi:hypothetical protein
LSGKLFDDPFFTLTVERALQTPATLLFQQHTGLDALDALRAVSPGLRPTAFIYHLSRCGSSLVVRMLQALARSLVIAEAEPIESVLRLRLWEPGIPGERQCFWLQGMISALGQPRQAEQRHLFVKLDSWQTLDLPLIARAYPGVPWIFLYRDPVEVLISHRRSASGRMLGGPIEALMLGIDPAHAAAMPIDELRARALASWCRVVLANLGQGSRLVEYRELPDAIPGVLAELCGLALTAAELEAMRAVALFDAKNPDRPFAADSESKRNEADAAVREPAERLVQPLIEELDARRHAQPK